VRLPILGQQAQALERVDAARNRARILDAARRLLARRPIREIGMDEVARAAGVGKGTLYRRFADRSALCHALLDESERRLQEQALRGFDLPRGTPALAQLLVLLEALLRFAMENAVLLAEARAFERGHKERIDLPVYTWRRRAIARLIEQAAREGSAPPIDADVAANLILATLDPDLMLWSLDRSPDRGALREAYLAFWRRSVGVV
jgi:AcrR family transcriptional regulator